MITCHYADSTEETFLQCFFCNSEANADSRMCGSWLHGNCIQYLLCTTCIVLCLVYSTVQTHDSVLPVSILFHCRWCVLWITTLVLHRSDAGISHKEKSILHVDMITLLLILYVEHHVYGWHTTLKDLLQTSWCI